jgi:hypothetical protein
VIRERDAPQSRERELSVALERERVARLGTAFADQETGERGYALTGLATFLEPYTGQPSWEQLVDSERSRQAVERSAAVVLTLRSQLEPDVGPIPEGWTVAATLRAAEGVVAGDCYDLFTARSGRIALAVVDIAGHGATEGILALRCKEMLRTALTSGADPGAALDTTAELLGDMGPEVFLTAFVAVIDTNDGRVRYADAGHPPAFVVRERVVDELGPTGPLRRPAGAGLVDRRGNGRPR